MAQGSATGPYSAQTGSSINPHSLYFKTNFNCIPLSTKVKNSFAYRTQMIRPIILALKRGLILSPKRRVLFTVYFYEFCVVHILPDRLWGPPILLFNGFRGFFSGVKRPGRNVDHTPSSSAEIENEWSYTSTPAMLLPGLDSGNFIVSFLLNL